RGRRSRRSRPDPASSPNRMGAPAPRAVEAERRPAAPERRPDHHDRGRHGEADVRRMADAASARFPGSGPMSEARLDAAAVGLRWGLAGLAVLSLLIGLYGLVSPHGFYRNVIGVDLLGPYNQHLLTDVGGFYLGFAVVFAWAARTLG